MPHALQDTIGLALLYLAIGAMYVLFAFAIPIKLLGVADRNNPPAKLGIFLVCKASGLHDWS